MKAHNHVLSAMHSPFSDSRERLLLNLPFDPLTGVNPVLFIELLMRNLPDAPFAAALLQAAPLRISEVLKALASKVWFLDNARLGLCKAQQHRKFSQPVFFEEW